MTEKERGARELAALTYSETLIAGNRGRSVGTQVPHALNANDQMDAGNENIGAGAGQAGRRRALT